MIHEHDAVVLKQALPELGLEAGDVGMVVHIYRGGDAYEVEFLTLEGETVGLATLPADQVRSSNKHEIPHVRNLMAA